MNKQAIAETQTNYVHMKTEDLLKAVKDNRVTHMNEWEEAHATWKTRQVEKMEEFHRELEIAIAGANEAKELKWPVQSSFVLREPRNYKKQYDKTIRRLEMTVDTEMYLTLADFDRYVMDEWSWKNEFSATAAVYNKR